LQELALIPAIKDSTQLKIFLGINVRFPDLCGEFQTHNQQQETQTSQPALQMQNFKILGNLVKRQ
jgi:hypothetical protein